MSKEEYNKLLMIRDVMFKGNDYGPTSDFNLPAELEPLPEYPFGPYFDELSIILDSGLFQDGQLKGMHLSGQARKYKGYQINNLVEFIWHLCDEMHYFEPLNGSQQIVYSLSNLVEAIEESINIIHDLFGKRRSSQIVEFKEEVKTRLGTMKEFPLHFAIKERDLSNRITDLFKKHILDAPDSRLYAGVSELLALFGIKRKPETIAMAEYRKRPQNLKK